MIQYKKINKAIEMVERKSLEKHVYYNENTILSVLKEIIKQGNKRNNGGYIECSNKIINIHKMIHLYHLGSNFSDDYLTKLFNGMTVLYSNNDNLITTNYSNWFFIKDIDVLIDRIVDKFINETIVE